MAALGDRSLFHCLQHCAALLTGMTAPYKSALLQVRPEFNKGLRQMFLQRKTQLCLLKGTETRRINNAPAAGKAIQLHMACGVPSPPQLFADICHLEGKPGLNGIENAGLSYALITCKGR